MNIHDEIKKIHTNVSTVIYNNDGSYTLLDADGNTITPDTDAINAKQVEVNNAYQSKQYARDRSKAYASLAEQLDMQYWDRVNGTSTWKEHIDAVKAAHPKPTE